MLWYLIFWKISSLLTCINIVFDKAGGLELDLVDTTKKHAHSVYHLFGLGSERQPI